MTPEMAFECVLVSRDPTVVSTLNRVLDDLSISTRHCLTPSKALHLLREGSTDLIVIDCDENDSACQILNEIPYGVRKQTVVAVSSYDRRIAGTDFVLRKPITPASSAQSFKLVYSRMLRDYRQHARYAVMIPVVARNKGNRLIPVTITNIGDGGVGFSTSEEVSIGDVLSFRLPLPNARRPIYIEARILWTRDYGISGGEFVRIPPPDLDILHVWLKSKCQVRKPLVECDD
jgi:CheY-like chemotaxis protein